MSSVMQITQITPANNAQNVYRDTTIAVTFDKAIASGSLTANTVRLYVMPNYAGQVQISSIVNPGNPYQILITPLNNLPANTDFLLLLRGDFTTGDNVVDGIYSTDASVLNGNAIYQFKTGSKTRLEDQPEVIVNVSGQPTIPMALVNPSAVITVLDTDPDDNATMVRDMRSIIVRFSAPVSVDMDALSISAERIDQPFSTPVVVPTIAARVGPNTSDPMAVRFDLSGDIFWNTVYTFNIDYTKVHGIRPDDAMLRDHTWTITSVLSPFYATPYQVRLRSGWLVRDIPDYVMNRYIFEASRDALDLTGRTNMAGQPTTWMNKLVICIATKMMAIGITLGNLWGIREKELADLRVAYDIKRLDVPIDMLDTCIDEALRHLGVSRGTQTAIKSYNATQRIYLGGRRTVFTGRTGWWWR